MQEILDDLGGEVEERVSGDVIRFDVLDPDEGGMYAGEEVVIDDTRYLYRGYKAWTDLAEILGCKMLTPQSADFPFVTLHFEKLAEASFHNSSDVDKAEKYGTDSEFAYINKMEEPGFLYYYKQALRNANVEEKQRILNLGVNRGDEFEVIKNYLDVKAYQNIELVGVDHSLSAVAYAKTRFPEANVKFFAEDINDLAKLEPGRFDLIISIGTLQSPGIEFKPFLMQLVQEHLEKEKSAMILGFPNCRWTGGEMVYGAKAPNYVMGEMSLVLNDMMFAKKYLQQHKFRVTVTGKQYLFLTATKIGA